MKTLLLTLSLFFPSVVYAQGRLGRFGPPSTEAPQVNPEWTAKEYCEEMYPWVGNWLASYFVGNPPFSPSEQDQWETYIENKALDINDLRLIVQNMTPSHSYEDSILNHLEIGDDWLSNDSFPAEGITGARKWLKGYGGSDWNMNLADGLWQNCGLRYVDTLDEFGVPTGAKHLVADPPATFQSAKADLELAQQHWTNSWGFQDLAAESVQKADAKLADAWGVLNSGY